MPSVGKTSSRRNSSSSEHVRETETSLSPQRTETTECRADIEPMSISKPSAAAVELYLRIKPAGEGAGVYKVLTETTLLTKFPPCESNARGSRYARSGEAAAGRRHAFTRIFGAETSQAAVFERSIKHRVAQLLDGESSTVMTYGTRDSGKTYTLYGTSASPGAIPRSVELVFAATNCTLAPWYKPTCRGAVLCLEEDARAEETRRKARALRATDVDRISAEARRSLGNLRPGGSADPEERHGGSMHAVWVSFAEIRNGNVYDLLDDAEERAPLGLAADGEGRAYACGLRRVHVITAREACELVEAGRTRTGAAATPSNPRSSRSHTIFTVTLLTYRKDRAADEVRLSALTFCDLAGPTQFEGRSREASSINNSLLVLGRCLKAAGRNRAAPFRDSKLTRMCQRALSGRESLTLIANVAFAPSLYGETQSTLAFCAVARRLLLADARGSCERAREPDADVAASPSVCRTPRLSGRVDPAAYHNLLEENARLTRELKSARSDVLKRDYAVRQELADRYARLIRELEATYRDRAKRIESEERDLLEWSVGQVERYYEERIGDLIRQKKRKREDGDDRAGDNRAPCAELGTGSARLASTTAVLKDAVKKLEKENRALLCERNKCCFELALVADELRKFRQLARAGIRKRGGGGGLEDDAERLMGYLERLTDEKLKRSEETLEEMGRYVSAARAKDAEDNEARRELSSTRDLLDDALTRLRGLEEELARKEACIAALRLQAETQERQFARAQERDRCKLDEWLNVSALFPSHPAEPTKRTSLNVSDVDRKSLFESSVDYSVSRSSDRSSRDDSGVSVSGSRDRGSTGTSDSANVRENEDKCTQTCLDGEEGSRATQGRGGVERLDGARRHGDASHIAELSRNLETISDVISALNEAARANERDIVRHERALLRGRDAARPTSEEEERIATSEPDDLPGAGNEMRELGELTGESGGGGENQNRTFERPESCAEGLNFFENKTPLMRDRSIDNASGERSSEHLPRIESLEEEVSRKNLRINELEETVAQLRQKFARGCELFARIHDFEIIASRWQRDRSNLCRQLCECSEGQLNLGEKLERLTARLAERESEVISLRSQVRGVTELNATNSAKVRSLNERVTEAGEVIGSVEKDLRRCKDLRETTKMEIDDLRSWLADYENNTTFINKMRKFYDNSQDEITSLRMQLRHKELEVALLTSDRDAAIQKYDILTRNPESQEKTKQLHDSDGSEVSATNNARIVDPSKKITPTEIEGQSGEPIKIHEEKCKKYLPASMCSTPKNARSEILNVSSASSDNSATSLDDKDDSGIKIANNDSCQADRNVTSTVPFVCEGDKLEVELYFDLRSSVSNKKKVLDVIEIRRTEGKTTLSQRVRDLNSDPESE